MYNLHVYVAKNTPNIHNHLQHLNLKSYNLFLLQIDMIDASFIHKMFTDYISVFKS